MDTYISRRSFIAGAGAVAAAGAAMGAGVSAMAPATQAHAATQGADKAGAMSGELKHATYKPAWLGDAPEVAESDITDTITADIVVMGGGNAGTMCACAAAEAGATVAVIEMQPKDSIFYYGLHDIAAQNSQYQLDHGVPEINKSQFIAEYQRRSHNRTNPRLVKKYVDNSGEMLDWLLANVPDDVAEAAQIHNLTSNEAYLDEGQEINRFTCWIGTTQVSFNNGAKALIEKAESQGAKWYWEYTGVKVETEEGTAKEKTEQVQSDGSVTFGEADVRQITAKSVIAQDPDGNYVRFVATKAVVLAGGDYGGNAAMYEDLQDEKRWLYRSHGLDTSTMQCSGFGRDGSGIKMALWAGGTMDPNLRCLVDPQVMFSSNTYAANVLRWGASFAPSENPWGCPFVWFDQTGRRFTDETFLGIFGQRIRAERSKPGRYYVIFDSKWEQLMEKSAPEHFSLPMGGEGHFDLKATIEAWVDRGAQGAETNDGDSVCAWGAKTLDDLLSYMPLDDDVRANIKAGIKTYNDYCAKGEDEDFGRDPKLLLPIDEGPFYGFYCVEEKPYTGTCTLNGVNIDEDQAVLDENYNPIVNLYATGNNSGGRFGIEYSTPMQGLTLGMAMTLGRVLGKELAAK